MFSALLIIFFVQIQSFITQDSGDRDLLAKHLRFFDVNVLNYTGGDGPQREPFEISEDVSLVCNFFFQVAFDQSKYLIIVILLF